MRHLVYVPRVVPQPRVRVVAIPYTTRQGVSRQSETIKNTFLIASLGLRNVRATERPKNVRAFPLMVVQSMGHTSGHSTKSTNGFEDVDSDLAIRPAVNGFRLPLHLTLKTFSNLWKKIIKNCNHNDVTKLKKISYGDYNAVYLMCNLKPVKYGAAIFLISIVYVFSINRFENGYFLLAKNVQYNLKIYIHNFTMETNWFRQYCWIENWVWSLYMLWVRKVYSDNALNEYEKFH